MIDFATLWDKHPAAADPPVIEPCTNAKGVSIYPNQCAIRMSVCLIGAGISLASFRGVVCWLGHGRQHALRAEELAGWLNSPQADFVPYADIRKRKAKLPISSTDYKTRQGIALFRNFWGAGNQGDHIDLWDGDVMTHGSADYFARSQEVWFWDLD